MPGMRSLGNIGIQSSERLKEVRGQRSEVQIHQENIKNACLDNLSKVLELRIQADELQIRGKSCSQRSV